MELRIKNQLPGTISLCMGERELQLEPEQDAIAPVEDGDCMYLDQLVPEKKQTPAEKALAEILQTLLDHKSGQIDRNTAITTIMMSISEYLETFEPIPYTLTDKAGGTDD